MATRDEAEQTVLDAIASVAAHIAEGKTTAVAAEQLGSTVRQLGEAFAWLKVPNQPH